MGIRRTIAAGLLGLVLSAPAQAQNILWYEDDTLGTSVVPSALALYGYAATQASSANFNTLLGSQAWDLVIFGEQQYYDTFDLSSSGLLSHVANGGKLLGATWLAGGSYMTYMQATDVAINPASLTGDGHQIFDGMASLNLSNPGWGVYAIGSAAAGSTCIGGTSSGGCAAVLGNGGNTLLLAPLFDSYASLEDGARFVGASADFLLEGGMPQSTVPEPISMVLMGTGLAAVGAVKRRRMKTGATEV